MGCSGVMVTGSTIIPLSDRLTLSISPALLLDGEVAVDHADASLLGHGDGQARLGDCVHGAR